MQEPSARDIISALIKQRSEIEFRSPRAQAEFDLAIMSRIPQLLRDHDRLQRLLDGETQELINRVEQLETAAKKVITSCEAVGVFPFGLVELKKLLEG